MITDAEHDEQRNEKNNAADNFAQKMRNRRLFAALEINVPDVAIDQCDHERAA